MSKSTQKLTEVSTDAVQIGERRAADSEKVQRLTGSIEETGLLHPIGVTPDKRLLYGLHRLEACKALGWKKIPALIHDLDDLHAELAEIDENLMRSNLTALEETEALARRKQIYDKLHPAVRHGGDRKTSVTGSSGQNGHLKSFAEDTAEKTGRSARTVRRYVGIAQKICKDVQKQLKGHAIEDKKAELEKLGRLPEADQRLVAEHIAAGAASVADAIREIGEPWSPEMRAIVIDKQALGDLGKISDYGMAEKDAELKRLAELPADEQRVVAKMVATGEAQSVFGAIDAMASPEPSGEGVEDASEPPADEDVPADLPAEATEPGDQLPENDSPDAVDPVTVYREFLTELPEKIRFLDEHFDEVMGNALEPAKAAEVLQQAIDFFDMAHTVEAEFAAEIDPVPCSV